MSAYKYNPRNFWAKVNKTGDCWIWTGSLDRDGYGNFNVLTMEGKQTTRGAHRVSYVAIHGDIKPGLVVDHTCHNRACVNPSHLRLATRKQNSENRQGADVRNSSGVRGVLKHKASGLWRVTVGHNRRQHLGGYFKTLEEAEAAAVALRNKLFTHNDADKVGA